MNDRFKFKAVLKTSEFTILVKPYYILEDSYFIDINQAEAEFKNKYPEECFWDLIDEIEKQDYVQEISSDNDLIITKDFTNLIQCTGLKDKNGKLIYEGDVINIWCKNFTKNQISEVKFCEERAAFTFDYITDFGNIVPCTMDKTEIEVIGNIYENKSLLESEG